MPKPKTKKQRKAESAMQAAIAVLPRDESGKPKLPKPDVSAERTTARDLYSAFDANRLSVPVKTLSAFKPVAVTAHSITRKPSVRQCAAIAVAVKASGQKLADNVKAARRFKLAESESVTFAIENGALRDCISSGLITVTGNPGDETLRVSAGATAIITGLLGQRILNNAAML